MGGKPDAVGDLAGGKGRDHQRHREQNGPTALTARQRGGAKVGKLRREVLPAQSFLLPGFLTPPHHGDRKNVAASPTAMRPVVGWTPRTLVPTSRLIPLPQ